MNERKTLITAHAGAEHTPANTMQSIRYLATLGADAIEVDVRRHEGKLMLSHNPIEPGQQADTLEECFIEVAKHPGLMMNIDVKHKGLVREVAELAEQCGVEDRLIFTDDIGEEDFPAIRERNLTVWYDDSQMPAGIDYLQGVRDAGFEVLNIGYQDLTDDLRAHPEALSLWTLDDASVLARYLGLGVLGITTNEPVLAIKLRNTLADFHKAWDHFPGAARLVDREGRVLAANENARKAGFVEGVRCATVKSANNHQGCKLKTAFETGEGQFDVSEGGLLRAWVPAESWDGAMVHLSWRR